MPEHPVMTCGAGFDCGYGGGGGGPVGGPYFPGCLLGLGNAFTFGMMVDQGGPVGRPGAPRPQLPGMIYSGWEVRPNVLARLGFPGIGLIRDNQIARAVARG
jgi:hypothetical protein